MTAKFEYSYQECEVCTESTNILKSGIQFICGCKHKVLGVNVEMSKPFNGACPYFNQKEKTFEELLATPYALIGKKVVYDGDVFTVCGDDRVVNPDSIHLFLIRNQMVRVWADVSKITKWKEPKPPAKQKVKYYKIFHKCYDYVCETAYYKDKQKAIDTSAIEEKDIVTIEEREFEI